MQGSPITFIVAFIVVLALIGVAAWLVRRFASSRLGANTQRGRMPRLAVIDAAAVDGRRRLVLVRRDNVEHLLMIGGPTDIVVEPNIVRAAPGRDQLPQRSNAAEPPRLAPMPDTSGWADEAPRPELLDHPEPQMPEPPPRPSRPSFADEVRRPAPALAERRSDPLAGFTPEPIAPRPEREPRPEPAPPRVARSEPPLMPRPSRHSEPVKVPPVRAERAAAPPPPIPQAPPVPPPAPAPAAPSSAEQNLAEMAQRLEAALRRPAGETVAPPVAPEAPAPRAARAEPPAAPAAPAKPATEKTSFENLEDEMASLLGRPKPPS
ncbi:flagellar biosynthesis protein FliO [Bradyrhizobium sp. CSA207]|uniref:flagellar biosynthetic protein FliO n=1 Tax=Bradyrhizobium sp. CSA207 TaxID=2698826 RepID=UPI0023B0B19C|nr:flagellar biosynthetic protein FliO [Bradyrhizobium sp. CSA207]MDE5440633.1 flagellar biosynthesis protein FliO [Bradyrhizobium sp. CSA207]